MNNLGYVKVAALSPSVTVACPEKNMKAALPKIIEASRDSGAQIIALPELFASAYTCGDLFYNGSLLSACEAETVKLAADTKNLDSVIIVGCPVRAGSRLYNCAVVMQHGDFIGIVPKTYLPDYGEFYEKRWFTPGTGELPETVLFGDTQVPFGRLLFNLGNDAILGIEICEDLWVSVPPSSIMSLNGANIIVNISASNELVAKSEYRTELVKQQSARCVCGYAFAGAGVGESTTDLVFSGACMVAENGVILDAGERFSECGSAVAEIDIQLISARRHGSSFEDNSADFVTEKYRTVDAYIGTLPSDKVSRKYAPYPFVPSKSSQKSQRCREIISLQSNGLAKRMKHIGAKKMILGISGGLDSTLALLVAASAADILGLPHKSIICVTMPGFGTTDHTKNNAAELVDCVGGELREINIVAACKQHMSDIGHDPSIHDVTYENVQARERTQVLMDLANKEGALLVGTGDLSELALGWCTYNGDHMSMYGVNAGVPKTLVRHIVKYVAEHTDERTAKVLISVLETPVSPELLPPDADGKICQKTEDKIGPYELHDFFLYYFVRCGFDNDKIVFLAERAWGDKYSKITIAEWYKVFIKRFFSSQFKRSCLPDGPKIGSISLSPRGDWRMPSDADFSAFDVQSSLKTVRKLPPIEI